MDEGIKIEQEEPGSDEKGFEVKIWCAVLGQVDAEAVLRVTQREAVEPAVAALVEQVRASGATALRCGWDWTDGMAAGGLRSCSSMLRP